MFKKYNTPEAFNKLSIEKIIKEIKTCGLYKSKAEKIKLAKSNRNIYTETTFCHGHCYPKRPFRPFKCRLNATQ